MKKALITLALLMAPTAASAVQHSENAKMQQIDDDANATMSQDSARWVDQTRMHDVAADIAGNCVQAAVASLLHVPLETVPDFADGKPCTTPEDTGRFWRRFDDYLAKQGLTTVRLPGNHCPESLHLASGMSPRGVNHMVVRQGDGIVFDPHPSRAGLLDIQTVRVLAPLDIAAWAYIPERRDWKVVEMEPDAMRGLARALLDQADRDELDVS